MDQLAALDWTDRVVALAVGVQRRRLCLVGGFHATSNLPDGNWTENLEEQFKVFIPSFNEVADFEANVAGDDGLQINFYELLKKVTIIKNLNLKRH